MIYSMKRWEFPFYIGRLIITDYTTNREFINNTFRYTKGIAFLWLIKRGRLSVGTKTLFKLPLYFIYRK